MEEIIKTAGIAISSVLALVVLFVLVRSQWSIYRQERRQEERDEELLRKNNQPIDKQFNQTHYETKD